nr:hypothetical protein [Tanacetum cinerariifolium]
MIYLLYFDQPRPPDKVCFDPCNKRYAEEELGQEQKVEEEISQQEDVVAKQDEKESSKKAGGRLKRKTSKAREDKEKRQKKQDDLEKLTLMEYVEVIFDFKEGYMKIMFKPDGDDEVWKNHHNQDLIEWKLYDSCRVHSLMLGEVSIHMLVEKKYPLPQDTLRRMLQWKLHMNYNVTEIAYELLRVLVNKSQNKTPYELFNGRTPSIGFLKPFGCHVMILNTLDHLGKFKAKRDEGYFIRYSMSSKAFRVFNKRTRRVEENLHVEFLENKAIEKGAGPNWLFDIDSLTKSMNYMLVDAESSLSKPQDGCSPKVPEGSGNTNPTASTSNPPANQMETLTVETSIPTVSSPVPTACLNDSPKPLSDARLISKRVANLEEIPSLDNILSLTNRFEDIFGVESSPDEAIGVEADVNNMETTITASPTPTLRIHKDHPKSQIIGPV